MLSPIVTLFDVKLVVNFDFDVYICWLYVISAKFLQPKKASFPIEVILVGIEIDVNPHHEKALSPIDIILSGMLIEVKFWQWLKV